MAWLASMDRMTRLGLRRLAVVALLAGGLAACGSDPEPPPKTVAEVNVMGAPTLNPDLNGRPSPVVVRFYQLAATEMFGNADFFQLFEQDQAALGPTSVAKQEHVVTPGQLQQISIAIKPDVKALGVVVAYRNFEKATWRAMVPVEQDKINVVQLQILSQNVQMKVEKVYVPTAKLQLCATCVTAELPARGLGS